jgi:hypothetical protein
VGTVTPVGHAVAAGAGGVVAPAHAARVNGPTCIHGEGKNVAEDNVGATFSFSDIAENGFNSRTKARL